MDGMDTAVMPGSELPGAKASEQTPLRVPIEALRLGGENGENVEPAIGDRVSVQLDAIVASADGAYLTLTPTAINGVPAEGTPAHEGAETPGQEAAEDDPELAKLRKQAEGMTL